MSPTFQVLDKPISAAETSELSNQLAQEVVAAPERAFDGAASLIGAVVNQVS